MPDPSVHEDPHVGQVFDGRYEILERIGEGGMGVVYRARQLKMDREVALKVLRKTRQTQDAAIARFLREMRTTSRINHPNVVSVFDFGETESGDFFLAMELLSGETLSARLDREGILEIDQAVGIGVQILAALGAAHKEGIVHRDLKPENIMLMDVYGERDQVRVLDFGIARFVEQDEGDSKVTRTGSFIGTPHYSSPEQAVGDNLDNRSDLYTFGVLLYRMVVGKLPFDAPGKPLRVLRMQMTELPPLPSETSPRPIPGWLDELLLQLLAKYPEDRPDSAAAVASRLARSQTSASETLEIDDARSQLLAEDETKAKSSNHDEYQMLGAALIAAFATALAGLLAWWGIG